MGNREGEYDVIRAVAMCFAIAVHTMVFVIPFKTNYGTTWYVSEFLVLIFFTCNGLFFMLSGKFTLGNKNLLSKGYGRYYLDKIIKIIVPLIIYSLIVYFFKHLINGEEFDYFVVLRFFKSLYEGDINKTYWFIYTLMGLYLVAPFLYKMVENMRRKDLKVLITVIFVFQIITVHSSWFSKGFGISVGSFGLVNWITYFILGFALEKICNTKKLRNIVMILGLISIVISIVEVRFFSEKAYGVHDLSITMVFITCLIFFLIRDFIKPKERIKKIISYISRYFLSIYLLHSIVLWVLSKFIKINQTGIEMSIKLILLFLLTLFISFLMGYLIETIVVKPIQRFLKKIT